MTYRETELVCLRVGHDEPWALELLPAEGFEPTAYVQVASNGFIVGPKVDLDKMVAYINTKRRDGADAVMGAAS